MTETQAKRLRRLIKRLVRAELDRSWMGVQQPCDHQEIQNELYLAKHALDTYITYLATPKEPS